MTNNIVKFALLYLTEANNCFFTVSEITDDYNSSSYCDKEANSEEIYKQLFGRSPFVHRECVGDKLGKFKLSSDAYQAVKQLEIDEIRYDWENNDWVTKN